MSQKRLFTARAPSFCLLHDRHAASNLHFDHATSVFKVKEESHVTSSTTLLSFYRVSLCELINDWLFLTSCMFNVSRHCMFPRQTIVIPHSPSHSLKGATALLLQHSCFAIYLETRPPSLSNFFDAQLS